MVLRFTVDIFDRSQTFWRIFSRKKYFSTPVCCRSSAQETLLNCYNTQRFKTKLTYTEFLHLVIFLKVVPLYINNWFTEYVVGRLSVAKNLLFLLYLQLLSENRVNIDLIVRRFVIRYSIACISDDLIIVGIYYNCKVPVHIMYCTVWEVLLQYLHNKVQYNEYQENVLHFINTYCST